MDREYRVPYIEPPNQPESAALYRLGFEKSKIIQRLNGGSSNGRTTDSDSVNLGSNPSPPATFMRLYSQRLSRPPDLSICISLKLLHEEFESCSHLR
jgi:hypothetical protein